MFRMKKEITFECTNPKCKKRERNPDIFNGCPECNSNEFQAMFI